MDPITGVGLAASVIHLVTFSIDTIRVCKELYQQDSLSEYSSIEYTTGHLASLTISLQQSLQSFGTRSPTITREEKDLVNLAQECEICANELQKELRKLQTPPGASFLKATRTAARAIRKSGSIDKIYQRLQAYQSTLETSLLSRLSQRFDTQGLQNDKSFVNLDKNLQHIITCLASSQTSLNGLVIKESAQTRDCITAQIDRVERLHIDDRRYEEILTSLFYPDISSRQEQVDSQFDGIENSYDWIFDGPKTRRLRRYEQIDHQKRAGRWDDFGHWLKSGYGVYWINGKAGSGKSTLMNHICSHSRRLELLGEWCTNRRLLTPTFFFWNAGTRLQKSIDGLLRSLVYQMLKECRELIACFSNEPLHTWTQSRLLTTLLNILRQSQVPVAICMFIDGLDEFDGPSDTVIDAIHNLADQTHVKVCMSSRPLLVFEQAFSGKASLRLQDLTFESIRNYAKFKLSEPMQRYISVNKYDDDQVEHLFDRLVRRADGVFLWAIIAVRDLREGLQGIANLSELVQTLETLPSELESLFMLMLNRIKPAFKRDAARFLTIVLYQGDDPNDDGRDLCRLYFSYSQQELRDAPFSYKTVPTNELVTACHTLRQRLLSHTAGILELTPTNKGGRMYSESKGVDSILFTKVNFLHKTVQDFLLNNAEAKLHLALSGLTEAQVRLSIARGSLVQLTHFSQGGVQRVDHIWPDPVYYPFLASLQQIAVAERLLGIAQAKLMQSLNHRSLVKEYFSLKPDSSPATHEAFMITVSLETLIDQVGMAASVGMTQYVCQQLDLSIESRHYPSSLPDLHSYSRNKKMIGNVSWCEFDQSRCSHTDVAVGLLPSIYRQALGECLQWKADSQIGSQAEVPSGKSSLAKTYMLSCCKPTCLDLVRILLRAGANPMVQIRAAGTSDTADSFWESWLSYLQKLRSNYIVANGRSGGIKFCSDEIDEHATLNDIFDVTKALIAQGADINLPLPANSTYLKRFGLEKDDRAIDIECSAMFLLEECFNSEPEFCQFASKIEPLVKRPTRENVYIRFGPSFCRAIYPSAKELKMLWPLIEKWEDIGRRDDLDALHAAMKQIVIAHDPNFPVRYCRRFGFLVEDEDEEEEEEGEEEEAEAGEDEGEDEGEEQEEQEEKEKEDYKDNDEHNEDFNHDEYVKSINDLVFSLVKK